MLVLTADVTPDALKSALRAGATDYATKPVDADELLLRTRNLLSIRAAYAELERSNATLAAQLREYSVWSDERDIARATMKARVTDALERGGPDIALQPVVRLDSMQTVGFEALARFGRYDDRTPDAWFADAASIGMATRLEISAVRQALPLLATLDPTQFLTVNVSPAVLMSDPFRAIIHGVPAGRVVFEITEHEAVDDYEALNTRVADLRRGGSRIAIDDAGAGYSSMEHILRLAPELIKLDVKLTRDIDVDPIKSALAGALGDVRPRRRELDHRRGHRAPGRARPASLNLGVAYGQGFHLGRPQIVPQPLHAVGIEQA